jgi:hypothetical protein
MALEGKELEFRSEKEKFDDRIGEIKEKMEKQSYVKKELGIKIAKKTSEVNEIKQHILKLME